METVAGQIRVRYEVVAGSGQGMKGSQPLADFSAWARRAMVQEEGEWKNMPVPTS